MLQYEVVGGGSLGLIALLGRTHRCCLKTQPTNGVHDSAPIWRQGQDNVLASCGIVVVSAAASDGVVVRCCTCSKRGARSALILPVKIYTHPKALIALFFL